MEHIGPTRVAALSLVSTCAWLTLILLPYEVAALSTGYHLGPAAAGWITAAELLALACAASWVGQTIAVYDKRRLTILGVVIALVATACCLLTDQVALIVALRLLFGVGTGIIAAATNALPALHDNPKKLFAYMQLVLGMVFALSIFAVGAAEPFAGRQAVFWVELILLLTLGAASLLLPKGIVPHLATSAGNLGPRRGEGVATSLAALGLMWVAQAALWAFAAEAGAAAGLEPEAIARWLAIAGFTAPIGGAAAAMLGERRGYAVPLIVGYTSQILVALAMYCSFSRDLYIASALVNNMMTTFTTPYLLGVLATLDVTGRATALGSAAVNFGCAVGPALGATLLGAQTIAPIGITSAIIFSLALALGLSALRNLSERRLEVP